MEQISEPDDSPLAKIFQRYLDRLNADGTIGLELVQHVAELMRSEKLTDPSEIQKALGQLERGTIEDH